MERPAPPPIVGYGRSLAGVFLYWALLAGGTVAARTWGGDTLLRSWPVAIPGTIAAALLLALAWKCRHGLFDWITSASFGAALITALVAATAVGTVIFQGAEPAEYTNRYGGLLGNALLRVGADDLFHSPWYVALLGTLAPTLILTAIRRRAWRPELWGLFCSHMGICIVLLGGLVGMLGSVRGFMDMRVGHAGSEITLLRRGVATGKTLPLGFEIKLEDFDVERYAPEYRLYVYERQDENKYRALRSLAPDDAREWIAVGNAGDRVRVTAIYPHFQWRQVLEAAPEGEGRPAAALDVTTPDGSGSVNLFVGEGTDALNLGPGGPIIRFAWEAPDEARLTEWRTDRPERHIVLLRASAEAEPVEVPVGPAGEFPVGDGAVVLRVLAYVPDFAYDTQTHEAYSRSPEPRNPAIRVAIVKPGTAGIEERWLYANFPDMSGHGPGEEAYPKLTYSFEAGYRAPARQVVVVGSASKLLDASTSAGWQEQPLEVGRAIELLPGTAFTVRALLASAIERHEPSSVSDDWHNPVIGIEHEAPGADPKPAVLMAPGHSEPLALSDGVTFVSFEAKSDTEKDFRSRLSVFEEGHKVKEQVIEVNHPLSYGGFQFYQSNFREDDPEYSGLLVVKDPGLTIVYAGFGVIAFGVLLHFYIRPLWARFRGAP